MKRITLYLLLCHIMLTSTAQVTTVVGGRPPGPAGYFGAAQQARQVVLPPFYYQPSASNNQLNEGVYKFAEPIAVNINLLAGKGKLVKNKWVFTTKLRVPNALSLSVNFNKFYLPQGAAMYLYNPAGTEITGPVTHQENNAANFWGSDVYQGDVVIIEVSLPLVSLRPAQLNINSIACGFRSLNQATARFGDAGACNVNVNCPEGSAWNKQKKSVALIMDPNGGSWTGVLVNNTCRNRIPYLLTAAHAALRSETQPISKWRFVFQYWSNTCAPNEDGSQRLLLNGATMKAYSTWSDFALLQLNQTPDPSSGIVYAGWNRSSAPSPNGVSLHHPAGDVMKLSYDADSLVRTSYPGQTGIAYWQADWNIGVTEVGSSGAPLFDSEGRVIGQLRGGYSFCGSSQQKDYYGCFDVSWLGSGNATSRLKDWLDPMQTDAMTLNSMDAGYYKISGPDQLCTSGTYTIPNLPAGATVTWQLSQSGVVSMISTSSSATLTRVTDGTVKLSATISHCESKFTISTDKIQVGAYPIEIAASQAACNEVMFTATGNAPIASYEWFVSTGDLVLNGTGNAAITDEPYVMATGTYGTIALRTANYCGNVTGVYADYLPYRRDFVYGMYQPILTGESLIASIAPVSYATEYRWYLNGTLVQDGSAIMYSTNNPNLLKCGMNELRVEAVTNCGVIEVAYDADIERACGWFRNGLSAQVYPNPAGEQVRIDLKMSDGKTAQPQAIERINIYDKLGLLKKQWVVKGMQQSVTLSVYDLPEGIYYIELMSNKQTVKQPLVIKR